MSSRDYKLSEEGLGFRWGRGGRREMNLRIVWFTVMVGLVFGTRQKVDIKSVQEISTVRSDGPKNRKKTPEMSALNINGINM
eukprot:865394-Amorphochlora_amoeboformis.AAC.1